jgi:hypothetical protein
MPRRPLTLPVLQVPTGPDPLLSAAQAAAQVGISEARWWGYYKRHALLVSGRRITEATPGGKGRTKWIQSYVTAHIHTEMRHVRDGAPATGARLEVVA